MGNLRDQWVIWVWIREQRADGEQHLANRKCWAPLILQDVETDATIAVHVRVVDSGCECNLWRFKWVVRWEHDVEEEDTTLVWAFVWSHDAGDPVEVIAIVGWSGGTSCWRVSSEILKLFLHSLKCHLLLQMTYSTSLRSYQNSDSPEMNGPESCKPVNHQRA
jgi:hypothetical protein